MCGEECQIYSIYAAGGESGGLCSFKIWKEGVVGADISARKSSDDSDVETQHTHTGGRPDPKDAHEAAGNHEVNPVDLLPSDYAIREVFDSYAPATAPPVRPKSQGLEAPSEPCGVRHSTPYRYHMACNIYFSANGDLVYIRANSRPHHTGRRHCLLA
ncbi:predicted protein [Aspergillus terreus NIH2624]|uniref:Uncharacterized protein n=1 Tax=Aspergillus terreus (strain NIH 2624 / FGSC A1156) TaxID=341663 RepID=Q0CHA3_ASPTN|nr:uncharacterized protein ATEG_06939 [Aspergillus terreus NIH2624]EAU32323.1 predicted protein [Aspergillus terreus NIH2624]